jgi:RimJ/RimL family protein N-acetyltransferase
MSAVLTTERLILRKPEPRDYEGFKTFVMSDRAAGIGGPHPERTAWRVFCSELGHWTLLGYGMWAVTRKGDDTAIGLIGPWTPADWPETEVGWTIWREEDEGTGIATEAARAAVAHAYNELGWDTVVSYVGLDNDRSAALAEKLGAVLDPDAPQPKPEEPCRVYRHPRPETRA